MVLKLGDKVRFIGISPKKYINKVGIINAVRPPERRFPYSVKFGDERYDGFPVLACEIEKVATKGEQLLFLFMEQP